MTAFADKRFILVSKVTPKFCQILLKFETSNTERDLLIKFKWYRSNPFYKPSSTDVNCVSLFVHTLSVK